MRKLLAASLLTLTLTASALAGDIPIPGGGAPCKENCAVAPAETSDTVQTPESTEDTLLGWLSALIFGA